MKRGEIYFASLNPTVGAETRKKRPVLIVSNNANNKAAQVITVIPITSNVNKIYPFDVFLEKVITGLSKDSKAQCNQIRTISKLRVVGGVVGKANLDIMEKIKGALKLHLDF